MRKNFELGGEEFRLAQGICGGGGGEARGVAFAGKVRKGKIFEARGGEAAHERGAFIVGEVAARAAYALFEVLRASARHQELQVVVRFKRGNIGLGEVATDGVERRADIRRVEIRFPLAAHHEADRVADVVRYRECFHRERADFKGLAILETGETHTGERLDCVGG